MEITRLAPFPLYFESDGFDAETDYVLVILDDHNIELTEILVQSDIQGTIYRTARLLLKV